METYTIRLTTYSLQDVINKASTKTFPGADIGSDHDMILAILKLAGENDHQKSPHTVEPRYNAVVGVHDFELRCTRGALRVTISATRELLNNNNH